MKRNVQYILAMFVLWGMGAPAAASPYQQSITLRVPRDEETGKYDERRACFSFKNATSQTESTFQYDLRYGGLAINNEDWFEVSAGNEKRSVIKDLGEHDWSDSVRVPVLRPLPELEKGQSRNITVDSSGDTHKQWAATNGIFAKAVVGHMYLVHIKDALSDFYALFRLEGLTQRKECTISWRLIQPPDEER